MAIDISAFDSTLNMSPLLQAIQGYRQGMDKNFQWQTNQNIGTKLAAGDFQGAQAAAGQGGADVPTLMALADKARAEQERQRQMAAFEAAKSNPMLARQMSPAYMAALEALPPEQRAAQMAQSASPMTQAQLAASRASAAHAAGSESRAAAMHPLDIQAKQKALEASQYGTIDPDKQMYRKRPDGSLEWIEPPQGAGPSKETIKSEAELRKEFTGQPQVKEYQTVRNAYQNVKAAAKDPSAAGDLSMIFAYMKILDPNSVVREQEFANAQNAAGVPDRVRNVYNRIMSGERLGPGQREDFLNQAHKLHANSQRQYESVRNQFGTIAKGAKARPDQVMVDFGVVPDPTAPQKTGGITQGYKPPAKQAPQGVPPQAVQMLRGNPTPQTMQQFDEIFGPGAAQRALGGQ